MKYKGAIIGFGGIAQIHAKAYNEIENAEIIAASDITPQRLQIAGELLTINKSHLYSDYAELLSKEKIDFVDICAPYRYHKEIATAASEQGVHVLCEKPMAASLEECDDMIQTARRNKIKLVVCHNWSHLPFFEKAKEIIESGKIGDPFYMQANVAKEGIKWRGSAREYSPGWRTSAEISKGGPILDDGAHLSYLAKWFLRSETKSVKATMDNLGHRDYTVEDFGVIINKFKSGAISNFNFNYFSSKMDLAVYIQGTKGSIHLPSPFSKTYLTDPIYQYSEKEVHQISIPRERPCSFEDDFNYSMNCLIQDFIAVMDGRRVEFPVTSGDGRYAIETLLAAYESSILDEEVFLPMDSTDPVYQRGVAGLKELVDAPS